MKDASTPEIRSRFLSFFEERRHRLVASSSLLPATDPTLLFVNAGMNQFKEFFLGRREPDFGRAVSCQKCVRAGGKHNDFENVGATARHLTFFEMLGSFSFGDYFKQEAVQFAWDFLMEVLELPIERLWFTVFETDDEAYECWRAVGVPENRLLRFGAKENYWSMGETGPCGPCSEIHFYRGDTPTEAPAELVNGPGDQTLEIWNLVFMQDERAKDGTVGRLPAPCVDTGAGLERLGMVLNGADTVFDTDILSELVAAAARLTGKRYGVDGATDVSLRVLADHARSVTFLLADGALPGREGRGYVVRRILRRAIRHGRLLGVERPFFSELCREVETRSSDVYPELKERIGFIAEVVAGEEDRFERTLSLGLTRLEQWVKRQPEASLLPGDVLFELHDRYGFPVDLAEEVARLDHGLAVDREGFDAAMEEQRKKARASWQGSRDEVASGGAEVETVFSGYETLTESDCRVELLLDGNKRLEEVAGGVIDVVLSKTPFYAEGGGQVGDTGRLSGDGFSGRVIDTKRRGGLCCHRLEVESGTLRPGALVVAEVDRDRRLAVMRNHTATHLLHAALRKTLGGHVKQAGSLVAPDRLRFDFTHLKGLGDRLLSEVEEAVNRAVLDDIVVAHDLLPLDQAIALGAMALFGEKYGEIVRTCRVGDVSLELCGGTHCRRTGEIGIVRIVSEKGVGSSVRRIEAVTGMGALVRYREAERLLSELERIAGVKRKTLPDELVRWREERKDLARRLARLKVAETGAERRVTIGDIPVVVRELDDADRKVMGKMADAVRREIGSGIVVLGSRQGTRAFLLIALTDDVAKSGKVHSGNLVKAAAPLIGGRGGGRPDFAFAGGKDPSSLGAAIESCLSGLKESLGE